MCSILQTELVRDHHGQPGDPLQHRHTGGDAPLERPAAEIQGRLPGGRTGVLSQRSVRRDTCSALKERNVSKKEIGLTLVFVPPQAGYIKR